MKPSILKLIIIFIIMLGTIGCLKQYMPPENVKTYNQMIQITSKQNKFNFKAALKITDSYMNAYMYDDMHPGTVNIRLFNNRFDIKKENTQFSNMILTIISQDLFVTYFGANTPFYSEQKYGYTYKIEGNVKTVYSPKGEQIYQITYTDKLILIHNIKNKYTLKVLNNKPISIGK